MNCCRRYSTVQHDAAQLGCLAMSVVILWCSCNFALKELFSVVLMEIWLFHGPNCCYCLILPTVYLQWSWQGHVLKSVLFLRLVTLSAKLLCQERCKSKLKPLFLYMLKVFHAVHNFVASNYWPRTWNMNGLDSSFDIILNVWGVNLGNSIVGSFRPQSFP